MVRPMKAMPGDVDVCLDRSVLHEFVPHPQRDIRWRRTLPYRSPSVQIEASGNRAIEYAPCHQRRMELAESKRLRKDLLGHWLVI
jgi:hypothetical protein